MRFTFQKVRWWQQVTANCDSLPFRDLQCVLKCCRAGLHYKGCDASSSPPVRWHMGASFPYLASQNPTHILLKSFGLSFFPSFHLLAKLAVASLQRTSSR